MKYLSIPTELIKSGKLTHTEIFIFIEISNLSELEKGCIASNEHFAELLGMSVKSVSNIISSLVKKGFIKTEIEKGSRNHIRRIFTIHNLGNYYPQNMDKVSTKYGESKEKKTIEEYRECKTLPLDSYSKAWNELAEVYKLQKILKLTDKRKTKLKKRISETTDFVAVFNNCMKKIATSEFLKGNNNRGWKIDFDFIIENDTNYVNILEGKYDGK